MSFMQIKSEELVLYARLNKGLEKLWEQKLPIPRNRKQTYSTGALSNKIFSKVLWSWSFLQVHFWLNSVLDLELPGWGILLPLFSHPCFCPPLQCKAEFTPQKSHKIQHTFLLNLMVPQIIVPLVFLSFCTIMVTAGIFFHWSYGTMQIFHGIIVCR